MLVLGLHFEHDAGATLMRDGEILISIEAERVTGIKHAQGLGPTQAAVRAAFAQSGARPEEVAAVAYSDLWRDDLYLNRLDRKPEIQVQTHGPGLAARLGSFAELGFDRLIPPEIARLRRDIPVFLTCHSMSHAAGALYMAGYERSAGLVIDAYGTCCAMMGYTYRDGALSRLETWQDRYILGAGYHAIGILAKEICSTHHLDVAGKVMGLQAYGQPVEAWTEYFRDRFFVSSALTGADDYMRFVNSKSFCADLFPGGLASGSQTVEDPNYCALVASMQQAFTEIVTGVVEGIVKETGLTNLFLSGGCAMNIIANAAVASLPDVTGVFPQPNGGDVGQALGSAILAMHALTGVPLHRPEIPLDRRRNPYVGAALRDDPAICPMPNGVARSPFDWRDEGNMTNLARRLVAGEIVGVVNGRSEIGPRALGNRSIFAHACFPNMKDVINHKIKQREWWRPFAPVCRLSDASQYFEMRAPSRYMLMNDTVREPWRKRLASITHKDGTARVQVLESRNDNPLLWDLLSKIAEQGAVPVLLNTSYNLNRMPLVNSTAEALELLINSKMDAAYVQGYLFQKPSAS